MYISFIKYAQKYTYMLKYIYIWICMYMYENIPKIKNKKIEIKQTLFSLFFFFICLLSPFPLYENSMRIKQKILLYILFRISYFIPLHLIFEFIICIFILIKWILLKLYSFLIYFSFSYNFLFILKTIMKIIYNFWWIFIYVYSCSKKLYFY